VKATAIDPNSAYAWLNKGAVLADMKRLQEALECFDRSLNIAPRYETALSNKGVVLGQLDQHHEALRCFDRALELNPKSGHAWFNKARLLEERGRFEEAATLYRGLLKASLKEHSLEEWTARTLDRIRAIGQSTTDGNNKRDKE
jgi:tetratricopeptide (TPR) repeat protein